MKDRYNPPLYNLGLLVDASGPLLLYREKRQVHKPLHLMSAFNPAQDILVTYFSIMIDLTDTAGTP